MPYIRALDGFRAICIVLVLAFHARVPSFSGGFLGVDLFFVLSGFLITTLLLVEYGSTGKVEIRTFLWRRCLRLYPALVLLVVLYLLFAPFLWPSYEFHWRDALATLLYLSDYGYAYGGLPHYLRHTWSLAVEFHFYLIWPFFLLFALRRLQIIGVLLLVAVLYALVIAARVLLISVFDASWDEVYSRFDTRLGGLLCGALLSLFMKVCSEIRFSGIFFLIPIFVFVFVFGMVAWGDRFFFNFGIALAEVSAALILWAVLLGYAKFLELPVLVWIGKLSYGIYLFHYPFVLYFRPTLDWPELFLVSTVGGLILAAFSYYCVERFARNFSTATSRPVSA